MLVKQVSITFMSGPRDGDNKVFEVDTPPLILTIGRREDTDICLSFDNQVSRLHAHLGFDGADFWLEDTGSRNGTFVEELRLSDTERRSLHPGDLFRIGRTWLRLDPLPTDVTAPSDPVDDDDDDDLPF